MPSASSSDFADIRRRFADATQGGSTRQSSQTTGYEAMLQNLCNAMSLSSQLGSSTSLPDWQEKTPNDGEAARRGIVAMRSALEADLSNYEVAAAISDRLAKIPSAQMSDALQTLPQGLESEEGIPASILRAFDIALEKSSAPLAQKDSTPHQVKLDVLLSTPTSCLSPEMKQVKLKHAEEARKLARAKEATPKSGDVEECKRHVNEILSADGEAAFPFDSLVAVSDPKAPRGYAVTLTKEALASLEGLSSRKPNLSLLINALILPIVEKMDVPGAPSRPPAGGLPPRGSFRLPVNTHPDVDKLLINRRLEAEGEPAFNFDAINMYKDPSKPNAQILALHKSATPQMDSLAKRKPQVYAMLWDLLRDFIDKGGRIPGYFKVVDEADLKTAHK